VGEGRWSSTRVPPSSAPGAAGVPGVSEPPRPGGGGDVPCHPRHPHTLSQTAGAQRGGLSHGTCEGREGSCHSPHDPPRAPSAQTQPPGARCPRRGRLQRGGDGAPHLAAGGCPEPPPSPPEGGMSAETRTPPPLAPGCAGPPAQQGAPRGASAPPADISGGPEAVILSPVERSHGEGEARTLPAAIRCHPPPAAGCRCPRRVEGRGREPAARARVEREPGGGRGGAAGGAGPGLTAVRNVSCRVP